MLEIEIAQDETTEVYALNLGFEGIEDFESLIGKELTISYVDVDETIIYDMRIYEEGSDLSLHQESPPELPFIEAYSIIGRYVYTEEDEWGVLIEIEDRNGPIYNLPTEVYNDDWSDNEVEAAVYVASYREVMDIQVN